MEFEGDIEGEEALREIELEDAQAQREAVRMQSTQTGHAQRRASSKTYMFLLRSFHLLMFSESELLYFAR